MVVLNQITNLDMDGTISSTRQNVMLVFLLWTAHIIVL